MLVTQTDPSPSSMRSAGVHGQVCPSGQTAPRRLTRPQTQKLGGDEHGCRSQNHPLPLISEGKWRGPVRGALPVSGQELSPWKPEKLPPSLCLLPALSCWIWTSQCLINTPLRCCPRCPWKGMVFTDGVHRP